MWKWILLAVVLLVIFYIIGDKTERTGTDTPSVGEATTTNVELSKIIAAIENHEYSVDEMNAIHDRCLEIHYKRPFNPGIKSMVDDSYTAEMERADTIKINNTPLPDEDVDYYSCRTFGDVEELNRVVVKELDARE